MTAQTVTGHLRNGKQNGVAQAGKTNSSRLWDKIQINEWTFTLFLFVLSLVFVAGKVFTNYGRAAQWPANLRTSLPSLPELSQVHDAFVLSDSRLSLGFEDESSRAADLKLTNVSRDYGNVVVDVFAGISYRCGWLLKAALYGLAMMGFTWFIIYKDSSIPGINPPMPFSPSKTKYPEKPRLQINYLVGVLNGILIFVYMCL